MNPETYYHVYVQTAYGRMWVSMAPNGGDWRLTHVPGDSWKTFDKSQAMNIAREVRTERDSPEKVLIETVLVQAEEIE